jgi:hypothetical protein
MSEEDIRTFCENPTMVNYMLFPYKVKVLFDEMSKYCIENNQGNIINAIKIRDVCNMYIKFKHDKRRNRRSLISAITYVKDTNKFHIIQLYSNSKVVMTISSENISKRSRKALKRVGMDRIDGIDGALTPIFIISSETLEYPISMNYDDLIKYILDIDDILEFDTIKIDDRLYYINTKGIIWTDNDIECLMCYDVVYKCVSDDADVREKCYNMIMNDNCMDKIKNRPMIV